MNIFKISGDFDRFDTCEIDNDRCRATKNIPNWEMHFDFDGKKIGDSWWPRFMNRHNDYPVGDYIYSFDSSVILLSERAVRCLLPAMGNVEILPLYCNFGDHKAVNVLTVLDCFDYEKSVYKRFSKSNENENPRIMCFDKFVFHPEKIEGHHCFKIVDAPKSFVFVDDFFVAEVQRHGVTGFKFKPVWSNEN